jgi:regulatory protein
LKRAGHAEDAIAETIERLRAQRALDDERFASAFARGRLAYHGVGRHRIRAGLRQRGVAKPALDKGLEEALRERPEQEVLDAVARRLLARPSKDEPGKRLLKVYSALLRRGFPASLVRERLFKLRKEARDILDGYQFEEPETQGDVESEDG